MARMDLKLRRDAPGMSVFWMILITGAGAFLIVAIVLLTAGGPTEPIGDAHPEIVAGEGDEPPGTSSFTEGEVAEEATQEPGELQGEAGELNEELPETGLADDTREAGTVGAVDADPAVTPVETDASEAADVPVQEPAAAAEAGAAETPEASAAEDEVEIDAPAEEIVTDPDTERPFQPTESGPEGRDDEVVIE